MHGHLDHIEEWTLVVLGYNKEGIEAFCELLYWVMRAAVFAQEIGSWEIIILGGHMSLEHGGEEDGNILFFIV